MGRTICGVVVFGFLHFLGEPACQAGFLDEYGKAFVSYVKRIADLGGEKVGLEEQRKAYNESFRDVHKIHAEERKEALKKGEAAVEGIKEDFRNMKAGKPMVRVKGESLAAATDVGATTPAKDAKGAPNSAIEKTAASTRGRSGEITSAGAGGAESVNFGGGKASGVGTGVGGNTGGEGAKPGGAQDVSFH